VVGHELNDRIRGGERIRHAWQAIAALTALRILGLILSPVELHGDEAQYWSWSREFAFGYFSKPPLIAWAIACTTRLFGDVEWAIRLTSPLAHAGAAVFLSLFARRRWGDQAGAWTALMYITMPAVWLSASIISTDALLLLTWSGALWALDRYLDRQSLARALALGAFVGAGFLAKYAMIYFLVGMGLLTLLDAQARTALARLTTLAAVGVVALSFAPNLIWNASNDFATLTHTAANANWTGPLFRPGKLVQFATDQIAVFGPITLVILVIGLVAMARGLQDLRSKYLYLAVFIAPPLLIVSAQAFISRANANWAAAAYAAGTVFVVALALERRSFNLKLFNIGGRVTFTPRWLAAALAIHVAIGAVFAAAGLAPAFADRIGMANAFKRARGWEATASHVRDAFAQGDDGEAFVAIALDNRLLFHELEYYSRDEQPPLRMWRRYADARNHADAVAPLTADDSGPVLIVSERPGDYAKIEADFADIAQINSVTIRLGGGKERRLRFYAARGYAPLTRGPEYEARWRDAE